MAQYTSLLLGLDASLPWSSTIFVRKWLSRFIKIVKPIDNELVELREKVNQAIRQTGDYDYLECYETYRNNQSLQFINGIFSYSTAEENNIQTKIDSITLNKNVVNTPVEIIKNVSVALNHNATDEPNTDDESVEIIKNEANTINNNAAMQDIIQQKFNDLLHKTETLTKEDIHEVLGSDINIEDESGETLAHLVMKENRIDLVPLLIEMNADFYRKNKKEASPLKIAFDNQRYKIVNLLIKTTKNHLKNDKGHTLLLEAAYYGQTLFVEWMLQKGCITSDEIKNQKDNTGNTAMLIAAYYGQQPFVKWMIENKFITPDEIKNQKNQFGNTAMLLAAVMGHTQFVEWMLENGFITPDEIKDQKNNIGNTAMLLAAVKGQTQFIEWMLQKGFITSNEIKNQPNRLGNTVMLTATLHGQTQFVKWMHKNKLVTSYEIKNQKNQHGNTAMLIAALNGETQFVEWMLENKLITPVEIKTQRSQLGTTAMLHAAVMAHTQFVEWMLEKGFITSEEIKTQTNDTGNTAMLFAAVMGQTQFVEWMLQKKFITSHEIRTQSNQYGNTAMLIARLNGQTQFLEWLMRMGYANPCDINNKHYNIFDLVNKKSNKQDELIDLFNLILKHYSFSSMEGELAFIQMFRQSCVQKLFQTGIVFASQATIACYLRENEGQKAFDFCRSILTDLNESVENKIEASITIANLFFTQQIQIEGIDQQKDTGMQSIICAYEYICDLEHKDAKDLKIKFDRILSGDDSALNVSQENNWPIELINRFKDYYHKKLNGLSRVLVDEQSKLIKKLTQEVRRLEQQLNNQSGRATQNKNLFFSQNDNNPFLNTKYDEGLDKKQTPESF